MAVIKFYFLVWLLFLFTITESTNFNLEEPFLFPFGPDQGDSFNVKNDDWCSPEEKLDYFFQFGPKSYSSLSVCNRGTILFESQSTFRTVYSNIAPFFGDVDIRDMFFDKSCDFYYYEPRNWVKLLYETRCSASKNEELFFSIYFDDDYIYNDVIRNKTLAWQQKTFITLAGIYYDDYISRLVFGRNTTKYINLANNVFKREMSSYDKLLAQQFIRELIPSFVDEWGYVVTWYKVGSKWHNIESYNSYQAAIICGLVDTMKRCFVLFDYFQLQWVLMREDSAIVRAGFNDGYGTHLSSSLFS